MTPEMLSSKRVSVRPGGAENGRERLHQDRNVHPERPVLEVVEVEPHQVVEAQVRTARNLPEAGDSGKHVVALAVPVFELLVVTQRERARAAQPHPATETF